MKQILHLVSIRNIISKSSYDWLKIYKIDIFYIHSHQTIE